jgi:hypothetical protein
MGGWAENIYVPEGKYIDPTSTPSPAALLRFFGKPVSPHPRRFRNRLVCKPMASTCIGNLCLFKSRGFKPN